MKTEINNKNKARFFALYWGQKVFRNLHHGRETHVNNSNQTSILFGSAVWLELQPLSSISDDDAVEVAEILGYKKGSQAEFSLLIIGKSRAHWLTEEGETYMNTHVVDYLRSRSYLLPWMGLSCEEIIEAGWAKYSKL